MKKPVIFGKGKQNEEDRFMGTVLRSELSQKNPYWIEKHRYYELKHFCLQYPIWKKSYIALGGISAKPTNECNTNSSVSDPTANSAINRLYYLERMRLIEDVVTQADPILSNYLLKGVTEGWSYDILKARLGIPCCKDIYYEQYRKFFWLLDKKRQ